MKEKLLKIIRHYGLKHQLKKLTEEIFELMEAITEYEMYRRSAFPSLSVENKYKKHIEEEFADVLVLLSQIKRHYNLDSEILKEIMDYKINRQLDRMKRGE
jgi:NTP pyrophosphatase (non-canonical NTP hydrolase)